jgi:hypothetical protein
MAVTQHLLADATTAGAYHGPPLVVSLALCGLWAWRGYARADRVEKETGLRPWGWSPTAWSVLCFASTLLGRLFLESAISRLKNKQHKQYAHRPVAAWPPAGYGPPPVGVQPVGPAMEPMPYFTAPATRDILPGR